MQKIEIKSVMKTLKERRLLVSIALVLFLALVFLSSTGEKLYKRHADFGSNCEDIHQALGANAKCVSLFFGTSRKPRGALSEGDFQIVKGFGNKLDDKLNLGRAQVSVPYLVSDLYPEGRKRGVVDHATAGAPEDKAQTEKYVAITTITKTDMRESFAASLRSAVSQNDEAILLFIHGFNVDFDSAVIRSAQLAVDIGFNENAPPAETYFEFGQPVLFSWPNGGVPYSYVDDRRLARKSASHLNEFLQILTDDTGVKELNVIVHSMGNRVFVNAITEFSKSYIEDGEHDLTIRVIHAAADVDQSIYDATMDEIERTAFEADYTVYASREDMALETSTRVNAVTSLFQDTSGRLGEIGENGIYVRGNVTSIDASGFATDLFGHGYFSNAGNVINDIACAFRGVDLDNRALAPRRQNGLPYYEMDSSKFAICLPGDVKRFAENPASYVSAHASAVAEAKAAGVYEALANQADARAPGSIFDLSCTQGWDTAGACIEPPDDDPPIQGPPPAVGPAPVTLTLYFAFNTEDLSAQSRAALSALIAQISNLDVDRILIEGHADRAGGEGVNQRLSVLRADAIRDYLTARGVDRDKVFIRGFGETAPMQPTADGERNPQNRRAQIIVSFK